MTDVAKKAVMSGKLAYARSLFADQLLDFLMLQEVRPSGDDPPPSLTEGFDGIAVVKATSWNPQASGLNASETPAGCSESGVALVIAKKWRVEPDSVKRHHSGRAVLATVSCEGVTLVVASVYMPSGLDWAPRTSRRMNDAGAGRDEADRILTWLDEHTAGQTLFIVWGDFNEVRSGPLDRRTAGGVATLKAGSLIDAHVTREGSRTTDLYRKLHADVNYTRFARDGSSASRIDYLLCSRGLAEDHSVTLTCDVMQLSTHSDHCAVLMSATGGSLGALKSGPRDAPWRPTVPRVRGSSRSVLNAVHAACRRRLAAFRVRWAAKGPATTDQQLDAWATEVARELVTGAHGHTPKASSIRGTSGRIRVTRRVARIRTLQQAVATVRHSVGEVRAGARRVRSNEHRKAVGELQSLTGEAATRHDDLEGLRSLVADLDVKLERDMRTAFDDADSDGADRRHTHMKRLFETDPGRFIDSYVKGGSEGGDSPDSVTDPTTNMLETRPTHYKRIIRYLVKKPMSVFVALQAAAAPPSTPSLASKFANLDASVLGARPAWWDALYSRDSKGILASVWARVLAPVTVAELVEIFGSVAGGKSPGPDGVSIDLLKLVCRPLEGEPGGSDSPNPCALALAELISAMFERGYVPKPLKEGWITLVPKIGSDGSHSTEADKMRPITLLSELGKMGSRVVAKRLCKILVSNPGFLSDAQRAFHMDGAVDQCTNVLVDVIEDWHHKKAVVGKRAAGKLYVVSYDQAKAYDKVNQFTIKASMERFNMPPHLIEYVLSGLTDATSRVRTYGGLTNKFTIKSSVRQGDPLAPIIYALITDALHEGLKHNPLFPDSAAEGGYTFHGTGQDGTTKVQQWSAGYADDTVLFAQTAKSLSEMHAWVRAFFGAHSFSLNTTKTKYLCSHPKSAPPLASVCGRMRVAPLGPDETIRYLGLRVNLNLSWKTERQRMHRKVNQVCAKIRDHRFTLNMTTYVIKQYLLPSLRLGLLTASVSATELQDWDKMLRQAALSGARMHAASHLAVDVFHLASGVPDLEQHCWALRAEELMVTLNADYPSSRTAWARLLCDQPHLRPGRVPDGARARATGPGRSRLATHIDRLAQKGVSIDTSDPALRAPQGPLTTRTLDGSCGGDEAAALGAAWRPDRIPVLYRVSGPKPPAHTYYTDGSTGGNRGRMSGSSVVQLHADGLTAARTHTFPVRASGSNYLAEVAAIVAAILLAPSDADVVVYSDCQSAIQAINRNRDRRWEDLGAPRAGSFHVPQRRRIVNACRPMLNLLRCIIASREGSVTLCWVHAHTSKMDVHSVMNRHADAAANKARRDAPNHVHALAGYELLAMRVGSGDAQVEVTGSYRKQVDRHLARVARTTLARDCPHQGRMAREQGRRLVEQCEAVRYTRDPDLIRFNTEVVAEWLPAEGVRSSQSDAHARGPHCKLCGAPAESVAHAICECSGNKTGARLRADAVRGGTKALAPAALGVVPPDLPLCTKQGAGTWVTAWFDPTGSAKVELGPGTRSAVVQALTNHDTLAGFIGIHPPYLDEALRTIKLRDGRWRVLPLDLVIRRVGNVRRALMTAGLRVWEARCRAMDKWWKSDEAAAARQSLHAKIRRSAAARSDKKHQKARAAHDKLHPATVGARSRHPRDSLFYVLPPADRATAASLARALGKISGHNNAGSAEPADAYCPPLRLDPVREPRPFMVTDEATLDREVAMASSSDRFGDGKDRKALKCSWY
jgi:exonuclease III/ribonuclease HI